MATSPCVSSYRLGCDQRPIPAAEAVAGTFASHYLQKLPAGFPSPAADYTAEPLDLNKYLIDRVACTFLFTVAGSSMVGAGIHHGDVVTVDRSIEARHGHVVVAIINNEFTIKRLFNFCGVIELHPENPEFEPISFKDGEELQVFGVVTGLVRKVL
jgi:DNA polymerase V